MEIDFTQFDLAGRSDRRQLETEARAVSSWVGLRTLLDPLPNFIMVLNENREIVFANQSFLSALEVSAIEEVLGTRPGECLQCERAFETPEGCGNSEACRSCGALVAILRSRQGQEDLQECRLLIKGGRPLEMGVKTYPVTIENKRYTVLHATDLRDHKRRRALERIFFHDILNHAGAIKGLVDFLQRNTAFPPEDRELISMAKTASEWLIEAIRGQKDLLAAEEGSLSLSIDSLQSQVVLQKLVELYHLHPCAEGRDLKISAAAEDIAFESDLRLLIRILGNLVKNALEASERDQTVLVDCTRQADHVCFSVHNDSVMPPEVQHQIFRRFFSLKGPGRGLGTYSVKLLTEEYLGGKVVFTSCADDGTVFTVKLPLRSA